MAQTRTQEIHTNTKWDAILRKVDDYRYVIPRSYKEGMLVDALIFSSPELLEYACQDLSLEQAANVATLPGIQLHSLAMPDMHQGYGFPIGGVAAMDIETGVVSPGGVGFDINCGVRLLTSRYSKKDVRPRLEDLINALFRAVPAGTGPGGRLKVVGRELDRVLETGCQWAVEQGYAESRDLDHTEEYGRMAGADPKAVSERAKKRGSTQIGTLGSGNHFLEVQYVGDILDADAAEDYGLFEGQVCLMIHCGSRGLGHQVCTDYVASIGPEMKQFGIELPDRELACVPIESTHGRNYLGAMAAAANYAWVNRQVISHFCQEAFSEVFGNDARLELLYDVAHNMAKFERHVVNGQEKLVLVHRKGATRAFPGSRPELAEIFRTSGQPVLIPGDMGRASYVLTGTERALEESFGSVCHGAGRLMSRTKARKGRQAKDILAELRGKGIIARSTTREGITEEVPEAYKPIDAVIEAVHLAGLAKPVARMKPAGVVKG